ncbi:hypothetical protein BDP27DRAFT_1365828 [Rhodocollybia butyracea]|uniref:Uncharacterized protein n=1 Tax=Rhodocollybia butyracea TaxID=206335 RepID=A0A9P5PQN7_9AGAR|nr:hypothetical protein BDP27DRAFT_1365828 [Rhodocollybia butyracea]
MSGVTCAVIGGFSFPYPTRSNKWTERLRELRCTGTEDTIVRPREGFIGTSSWTVMEIRWNDGEVQSHNDIIAEYEHYAAYPRAVEEEMVVKMVDSGSGALVGPPSVIEKLPLHRSLLHLECAIESYALAPGPTKGIPSQVHILTRMHATKDHGLGESDNWPDISSQKVNRGTSC